MADLPEEEIGPTPESGADFYLPHRRAKALDAAEVAIVQPSDDGVAALNADLARSQQAADLPEEAVEALARGWYEFERHPRNDPSWDAPENYDREILRRKAAFALPAAAPALRKQGAEQERERLKEALFSSDAIDDGDGALMVRSEVEEERFVADFESGLKVAWETALAALEDTDA